MVAPPTPQRIPLAQAVDTYLDVVDAQVTVGRLRPATRRNYAQDLANLISILGSDTITDDITGADVDRAISTYGRTPDQRRTRAPMPAQGRAIATQKRFYETLNRFFTHAATHAWVQVSPMQWVTLKPVVRGDLRTERTTLTLTQAQALLDHGAGPAPSAEDKARPHERNYERDRLLLSMLVILGPRVQEVAAANRQDITRTPDGLLWRIVGKGGKARTVPLSAELAQMLEEYLACRPAPRTSAAPEVRADAERALFRTGRGVRMSARDVQRLVNKAAQRVAVVDPEQARGITPHALRHTAATLMLASGWDAKVVAELLGHENIATTSRYLDQLPGELAAALRSHPLLGRLIPDAGSQA